MKQKRAVRLDYERKYSSEDRKRSFLDGKFTIERNDRVMFRFFGRLRNSFHKHNVS